jgi:hypothetical protein
MVSEQTRRRLNDEIAMVRNTWDQFAILFHSGRQRTEILNACAPWFFGLTQRVFLREVILGISRLTDPPTQQGHSNLVIKLLLDDPEVDRHRGLRRRLETAIDRAHVLAAPIRKHRDKYIAHLDHRTAVRDPLAVLPGVRYAAFAATIRAIERAYNVHGRAVHDSDTSFSMTPMGDASALMRALETSERWRTWERVRGGARKNASAP